jgi:hypothetical protein
VAVSRAAKTSGMRALHTGSMMVKSQVEFVGIARKNQSSGSGRKTAKVEGDRKEPCHCWDRQVY